MKASTEVNSASVDVIPTFMEVVGEVGQDYTTSSVEWFHESSSGFHGGSFHGNPDLTPCMAIPTSSMEAKFITCSEDSISYFHGSFHLFPCLK